MLCDETVCARLTNVRVPIITQMSIYPLSFYCQFGPHRAVELSSTVLRGDHQGHCRMICVVPPQNCLETCTRQIHIGKNQISRDKMCEIVDYWYDELLLEPHFQRHRSSPKLRIK